MKTKLIESFKLKRKKTEIGELISWKEIPEERIPTSEHIGMLVWIAGEFKTKKYFLASVHNKGEKGWPKGGYTVKEEYGKTRFLYLNQVRLHPDNFKRRRKSKELF